MNQKTQELLDRTFNFGVSTLMFLKKLPDDYIYRVPKLQVARSSVSIGANYEEAQGAVSRRDFANKIGVSYKESRETIYWMRILRKLYPDTKYDLEFNNFLKEATEIKHVFTAIKKSVKT
jgi:four helix bundle protein